MSLDSTQQPADMAPPDSIPTPELEEHATQIPEPTPTSTDIVDTQATPAAAAPATSSPHASPEATPVPPEEPAQPQPAPGEQPAEEPPTLVHATASQATSPQPPSPSTTVSPPATKTPTPTPVPGTITGQLPAPPRSRRRSVLAVISAICIIALLASGSYLLFNLLTSHTESDVARIVPSDTVALVSVDLVAAAAHGQQVTAGILGNAPGQGDALTRLTGLDWNKDVLPWVGRDMAFAVLQRPSSPSGSSIGGQGVSATTGTDTLGGAFLLQSRDDGAAQTAMRKAAMYQQNLGFNIATLDYRGLTLYHASLLRGDESGTTLAAGRGWAIVAGDIPTARSLIDRLTGNGSAAGTLAGNSIFRDSQRTLPHNRFGTIFLNTRALMNGFAHSSSGQTDIASTVASTYPFAVGYLAWTPDGLRAQFTFPSAHTVDVDSLAGDTTTLANVTPAEAFAYTGVANLGAMLRAHDALTAQSNTAGIPELLLGLTPTDPAVQQPAAFSLIGEPSGTTGFLTLLNAPDRADALALIGQSAEQQHWTLQTTTIAGVSVTACYAKLPPAQTTPASAAAAETTNETPVSGARLVGMSTWLDNTLIFASDATVMADAIHTIRDHAPNIAQDAHFQQLLRDAPRDGSATTFIDLPRAALTGSATTSVLAASLASHFAAILVTHEWNSGHYQATADLLLPK